MSAVLQSCIFVAHSCDSAQAEQMQTQSTMNLAAMVATWRNAYGNGQGNM
jgi:hypothetical protein